MATGEIMAGNILRPGCRSSGKCSHSNGLSGFCAVAAFILLCSAPLPAAAPGPAQDMPRVTQRHCGTLEDGSEVTLATLANGAGVEVDVLTYGGIISRLVTPDSAGRPGDIVLALDSLEEYVSSSPYFG